MGSSRPFGQRSNLGALGYGADTADIFRRTASYVDRILKGETPANLPVQSPDKYELFVNGKTAKALTLSLGDSFCARMR
jgi:ABC-type uncharacterized transport system substrate-binding protein